MIDPVTPADYDTSFVPGWMVLIILLLLAGLWFWAALGQHDFTWHGWEGSPEDEAEHALDQPYDHERDGL